MKLVLIIFLLAGFEAMAQDDTEPSDKGQRTSAVSHYVENDCPGCHTWSGPINFGDQPTKAQALNPAIQQNSTSGQPNTTEPKDTTR